MLPRIGDASAQRAGTAVPLSSRGRNNGERSGQKEDLPKAALKACCHLFSSTGMDLTVLASSRRHAMRSTDEEAEHDPQRPRTTQATRDGREDLPKEVDNTILRKKKLANRPLSPLSSSRSKNAFGDMGFSVSQVGSWLDSRTNRKETDIVSMTPRKHVKRVAARRADQLSEGERFILKRCKDALERRFGTLVLAFRRLDANQSNSMSMMEFMEATVGFIRRSEAQILYRLLDQNSDAMVTFAELQSMLEGV